MTVHQYRRVTVLDGKHGIGDYRVQFAGQAPTHGELLTMLWWIFRAEDRYVGGDSLGRRMLWLLIKSVYNEDFPLPDLVSQADGQSEAA